MKTYEEGFRDGQNALFRKLYELSVTSANAELFCYKVGQLHAAFI